MRTVLILIFIFIPAFSYSQAQSPESKLFNYGGANSINNANSANAILHIGMEIQQPIVTTVNDDMNYLSGLIINVETREIEEANVVSQEAKITVKADPSANYTINLDDQKTSSDKSLSMSVTDSQNSRTLPESGSDTFNITGVFVTDVSTDQNELPSKTITVVYDSV